MVGVYFLTNVQVAAPVGFYMAGLVGMLFAAVYFALSLEDPSAKALAVLYFAVACGIFAGGIAHVANKKPLICFIIGGSIATVVVAIAIWQVSSSQRVQT